VKIAQVASLIERTPPTLYGGAERVASYLTEELVRLGHQVTLFASAQSVTTARLVPCCAEPLRLNPGVRDVIPYYMIMVDKVRRMACEFDIIHFHFDQFHFPVFHDHAHRTLTTLHGRQDLPDLQMLYVAFPEMPLVSISHSQRAPIRDANFAGTVYHGLPLDLLMPTLEPLGDYLAFLGRISPEKGVDRAIAIARAVNLPLKIAAKIDRADENYYRTEIAPKLEPGRVEYIGEIGDLAKAKFLGAASALLFPIDWPEPFGLVMIEAMACGTPVLAFDAGAVREIIDEGITGKVVRTVAEAVGVLNEVLALDRVRVRRRFEQRFSAHRMAIDYIRIYERMYRGANFRRALLEQAGA
jgi:glycosyltransferase involved in cell wall biosynthesis